MSQLEIRALVGSLRRHSMNRGLFQYALEHTPEGVHLEEVPISNLPLFSEDLEANPPESVIQLWMALRAADAFWFITPEYNYSIPGALKNAIDWGSRAPNRDTFYGKVGAIMGASGGGYGTVRAQLHLRHTMTFLNMIPLNKPEIMLARAQNHFDPDGRLQDPAIGQMIDQQFAQLIELANRFRSPSTSH